MNSSQEFTIHTIGAVQDQVILGGEVNSLSCIVADSVQEIQTPIISPPTHTIETYRQALFGVLDEIKRRNHTETSNEIHHALYYALNKEGRSLKQESIISRSTSLQENEAIIDLVREIDEVYGVNNSDFMTAMGGYIRTDLYNREALLEIIDSTPSGWFGNGILKGGGHSIVYAGMTNEEIVGYCTSRIKKHLCCTNNAGEYDVGKYMMSSAHNGHEYWRSALDYIQLGDHLDMALSIGESLGDEFVWEKILREKAEEIQVLPKEQKMSIVERIVGSINTKRGLSPTVVRYMDKLEDLRGLGFVGVLQQEMFHILSETTDYNKSS